MPNPILVLFTALALAAVPLSASLSIAQDSRRSPEVITELEHDQVYEGESVLYRVTLNHVEDPSPPQLIGFDQFDVRLVNERSLNSRSIEFINGIRSETILSGRAYDYLLTPKSTGRLTIPAPTAIVDGKSISGRPMILEVRAADEQDLAVLEMSVVPEVVYPTQPFDIELTIAIKELPEPLQDRNPLSVQRFPAALSIPWAGDDQLPEGITPWEPWQRWIEPQQSSRFGFSINELGVSGSVFSLLERSSATFLPPDQQRTRRPDLQGRSTGYWQFTFARRFTATRAGAYEFGPVTLKGTFGTRFDGQLEGDRVFALARRISVNVKDVPIEGRPSSYVGVIGKLRGQVELAPRQAKVGDPMKLTVSLTGSGSFDGAVPPKLAELPEVRQRFRVYDATSQSVPSGRSFTFSVRPLSTDVSEFPSLPLAYFDPLQEQFVTIHTSAIPVQIDPSTPLAEGDIAIAASNGTSGETLEAYQKGVFPNIDELSALEDQTVHADRWLLSLLSMTGGYLVIVIATRQVRRSRSDGQRQRRRAAPQRARQRLRQAAEEVERGEVRQAADQISAALIGFIADWSAHEESGMTSSDAGRLLREHSGDEALIVRFEQLLELCDSARYGAAADSMREIDHQASSVLEALITDLKGPGRTSAKQSVAGSSGNGERNG